MTDKAFPRGTEVRPGLFDAFFQSVPEEHLQSATDEHDPTRVAVVKVTSALITGYRASALPFGPAPAIGLSYLLHWDEDGDLHAYAYGRDLEAALADARPFLEESRFGDEPYDVEDAGPALTVLDVTRPVYAEADVRVVVMVEAPTTVGEVLAHGLAAVKEGAYGFGGRVEDRPDHDEVVDDALLVVLVHRS
jgi:hypothetical protein